MSGLARRRREDIGTHPLAQDFGHRHASVRVLELLEQWPAGPFYKEDGEMIIDAEGHAI